MTRHGIIFSSRGSALTVYVVFKGQHIKGVFTKIEAAKQSILGEWELKGTYWKNGEWIIVREYLRSGDDK